MTLKGVNGGGKLHRSHRLPMYPSALEGWRGGKDLQRARWEMEAVKKRGDGVHSGPLAIIFPEGCCILPMAITLGKLGTR